MAVGLTLEGKIKQTEKMAEILFGERGAKVIVLKNPLNKLEGIVCYPPTAMDPKFRIAAKTEPMATDSEAYERMYVELVYGLGKVSDSLLDPIPADRSVKASKCWFSLDFQHRES